jgi:hypothetical protein
MVSALFVASFGHYFSVDGVDPWDAYRNAMLYRGPNPVIAHPPCQLWIKMARVNFKRWGGEHNRPGNDGGTFSFALSVVNRFGGVLEHPAQSYAWDHYGITKPEKHKWSESGIGWVCEVWQSAYGHPANKATWLYYVGNTRPFDLDWSRPVGRWQVGCQDKRGRGRNKPTLSKKQANSTPTKFRDTLIDLAEHSKTKKARATK